MEGKTVSPEKPLRIIYCIPGNTFTGHFLESWTSEMMFCSENNIQWALSRKESNNIYYVRNMRLGADVTRGKHQKPFDGKVDYDYLMWIDSDIIFKPGQIMQLLRHKADIISGLYLMGDGRRFATVKNWDEERFKKEGSFRFLTPEDIKDVHDPFDVSYTGMGFMLIKKGVFESMEYPWFEPRKHEIGDMVDYSMEDVSFCLRAKEMGFCVRVDPKVIVGHEKKVIL